MDWVTGALISWGNDRIKFDTHTGYSSTNTLARIFEGSVGKPGHRILCGDMKGASWRMEVVVMHLDPSYRDALIVKFASPRSDDAGKYYTNHQLAQNYLGISKEAFKSRVRRGKQIVRENHLR